MQVDENTIIGDILDGDSACAVVFQSMGMTCMECPSARSETVREACEIHGIDKEVLLTRIRAHKEKFGR